MVKIRYAELPAGLHVTAQAERHGTVVYLLPGLTADQRRAALVRARSSARMGHGPSLPAPAMAVAIAADRASTNTHNSAAAVRRHPMLVLPPLIALVATAVVFVLMSSVTLAGVPHNKAAATVPTLGIGAGEHVPHHRTSLSSPPSQHHSRRHSASATPSATPLAPGSAYAGQAPSGSWSPGPTRSPTRHRRRPGPSPSPSASGTCLKLGPLGLCVTI